MLVEVALRNLCAHTHACEVGARPVVFFCEGKTCEKAKNQERIKTSIELAQSKTKCEWLEVDLDKMSGTYKANPDRSELPQEIQEQLIVEYYSKM